MRATMSTHLRLLSLHAASSALRQPSRARRQRPPRQPPSSGRRPATPEPHAAQPRLWPRGRRFRRRRSLRSADARQQRTRGGRWCRTGRHTWRRIRGVVSAHQFLFHSLHETSACSTPPMGSSLTDPPLWAPLQQTLPPGPVLQQRDSRRGRRRVRMSPARCIVATSERTAL